MLLSKSLQTTARYLDSTCYPSRRRLLHQDVEAEAIQVCLGKRFQRTAGSSTIRFRLGKTPRNHYRALLVHDAE